MTPESLIQAGMSYIQAAENADLSTPLRATAVRWKRQRTRGSGRDDTLLLA
jgi:hypothetical protein